MGLSKLTTYKQIQRKRKRKDDTFIDLKATNSPGSQGVKCENGGKRLISFNRVIEPGFVLLNTRSQTKPPDVEGWVWAEYFF